MIIGNISYSIGFSIMSDNSNLKAIHLQATGSGISLLGTTNGSGIGAYPIGYNNLETGEYIRADKNYEVLYTWDGVLVNAYHRTNIYDYGSKQIIYNDSYSDHSMDGSSYNGMSSFVHFTNTGNNTECLLFRDFGPASPSAFIGIRMLGGFSTARVDTFNHFGDGYFLITGWNSSLVAPRLEVGKWTDYNGNHTQISLLVDTAIPSYLRSVSYIDTQVILSKDGVGLVRDISADTEVKYSSFKVSTDGSITDGTIDNTAPMTGNSLSAETNRTLSNLEGNNIFYSTYDSFFSSNVNIRYHYLSEIIVDPTTLQQTRITQNIQADVDTHLTGCYGLSVTALFGRRVAVYKAPTSSQTNSPNILIYKSNGSSFTLERVLTLSGQINGALTYSEGKELLVCYLPNHSTANYQVNIAKFTDITTSDAYTDQVAFTHQQQYQTHYLQNLYANIIRMSKDSAMVISNFDESDEPAPSRGVAGRMVHLTEK